MSVCSIDGCNRIHRARGLCHMHYARKHRHGSTEANPQSPGKEWLDARMADLGNTDDCMEWPFTLSRNGGYAVLMIAGRVNRVTHLVLEAHALQRPAPPNNFALHSCDNPKCVNPRHLRWGNHTANVADALKRSRYRRGERLHWAKLTEGQVIEIRQRLGEGRHPRDVADEFNVSDTCIRMIWNRKTWAWL